MYDSSGMDKGRTSTCELCCVSSSRWQMESHSYFVVTFVCLDLRLTMPKLLDLEIRENQLRALWET